MDFGQTKKDAAAIWAGLGLVFVGFKMKKAENRNKAEKKVEGRKAEKTENRKQKTEI